MFDLRLYSLAKKKSLSRRARSKQLSCKITPTELRTIFSSLICEYCKKACKIYPDDESPRKHDTATLDRVDPLLGYDPGNVVLACFKCNQKKGKREERMVRYMRHGEAHASRPYAPLSNLA